MWQILQIVPVPENTHGNLMSMEVALPCAIVWFGDMPARNGHIIGIEMASVALPDLFSSEICSLRA